MIVDTHCHLDFHQFDEDREEMIERARGNGVVGLILIGIDPASWETTSGISAKHEDVWRAAGLHPNSVEESWDEDFADKLRDEIATGDLVAVGETGVDLYRSKESRDRQMDAFDTHLGLAASAGLPIVIHQRHAEREVLDVLSRHGEVRGVVHCFSGDWEFARRCLDHGLHLGIGGVATYKSAGDTRDVIRRAPEDRLILETDAPFLAPQSKRGKRNEPAFLPEVVQTVAECRLTTSDSVERTTTQNASELFGLGIV